MRELLWPLPTPPLRLVVLPPSLVERRRPRRHWQARHRQPGATALSGATLPEVGYRDPRGVSTAPCLSQSSPNRCGSVSPRTGRAFPMCSFSSPAHTAPPHSSSTASVVGWARRSTYTTRMAGRAQSVRSCCLSYEDYSRSRRKPTAFAVGGGQSSISAFMSFCSPDRRCCRNVGCAISSISARSVPSVSRGHSK